MCMHRDITDTSIFGKKFKVPFNLALNKVSLYLYLLAVSIKYVTRCYYGKSQNQGCALNLQPP